VVPLQELVKQDPVDEAAQADAQHDAGAVMLRGRSLYPGAPRAACERSSCSTSIVGAM